MSLASLVSLQVKMTYRVQNTESVSEELLRALKRMPKLETLDLQDSLITIPESFMSQLISLPRLRSLQIIDCHAVVKLIPILDLPTMEHVKVHLGPISDTDLLPNLTLNTELLHSLHVDFTCSAIRIKGWCCRFALPVTMSMTQIKPNVDIHLHWQSTVADSKVQDWLDLSLGILHVDKASCLYLFQDEESVLTTVAWRSLSKRLPSLTRIYVGIRSSFSFVENALAVGPITNDSAAEINGSSVDAVAAPIFPLLRYVTLGARLDSFQTLYDSDSDDADTTDNKDFLGELLVRGLAERRERSGLSAVTKISYFGGIGKSDLKDRLKEFVPKVTRLRRAQWPEQ